MTEYSRQMYGLGGLAYPSDDDGGGGGDGGDSKTTPNY